MSLQDHQWFLRSTRVRIFFLDLISLLEEILGSILEATGGTIMNCWEMRGGVACIGSDSCLIAVLIIITSSWSDFMSKQVEKDIALESRGVDYDDDCDDDDVHLMERRRWWKRIDSFFLSRNHSLCQSDDDEEDAREQVVSWSTLMILSCCFSLAFSFLFTFDLFSALFSSDCSQSFLFGCMTITSLTPYEL